MKLALWIIFLLVAIFIALPFVTVFKESIMGKQPFSEEKFKSEIQAVLKKVPQEKIIEWTQEWFHRFSEEEQTGIYKKILKTTSQQGNLNLDQVSLEEIKSHIQKLGNSEKERFHQAFTLELAYQKRAILVFKIEPLIDKNLFKKLRAGYESTWTLEHYQKFFGTPYLWGSLIRSFKVATITTFLTIALAYLFAFTLTRTTCPFKSYFNYMVLFPLISPPVMMAFSLILLFGRRGIITRSLLDNTLHLINAELSNIYGFHGIILSQMFTYAPLAFVVLYSVMSHLDTRLEEAAENLGASQWYTFRRVTLPLSFPGIATAAVIVFIKAMNDFGNPRVVAADYTMVAGVMYDQMIGFQDSSMAAVIGVMITIPTLIAYFFGAYWLSKKSYVSKEPTGMMYVKETPKLAKIVLTTICFFFSTMILILYVTVITGSLVDVWGVKNQFTLRYWISSIFPPVESGLIGEGRDFRRILPLLFSSARIMAVAAIIGGFLAVVMAYIMERRKTALSKAIGGIILVPAALPGVVLGLGYILCFNKPFGYAALSLTGTMSILVLAVLFTRIYMGVMTTQSVLQKTDYSVEEAATSLGANRFLTFRRVVFPVLKRAWLLGTLYVFISGIVSLGTMIFLYSPENMLVSVEIYRMAEMGQVGMASLVSTYLIIIVLIVMSLIRFIERRDKYSRSVTSIKK